MPGAVTVSFSPPSYPPTTLDTSASTKKHRKLPCIMATEGYTKLQLPGYPKIVSRFIFYLKFLLNIALFYVLLLSIRIPALYRRLEKIPAQTRPKTQPPIRDTTVFQRLPKRLGIIFNSPDHDKPEEVAVFLQAIVKVLSWCSRHEIWRLTVYEKSGIANQHLSSFQEIISSHRAPRPVHAHPSVASTGAEEKLIKREDQEEDKDAKLQLNLLNYADGRPAIVSLTQGLIDECRQGELAPEQITQDLVDDRLRKAVGEETDLLIVCNPSFLALEGYPPWHLRLTEIFHVDTGFDISYEQFIRALARFAGAEMRFGR